MRILFVGMAESVHTARWIGQLAGLGWDLHLFPTTPVAPHASLTGVTMHTFSRTPIPGSDPGLRVDGIYPFRRGGYRLELAAQRFFPARMTRPALLAALVRRINPDVVHSLGIQHGGYLTREAKQTFGSGFPPWLVSCWGNDLYLLGRLSEHAPKIKAALAVCDYFAADCERDVGLARQYGFAGETLPALPGAGGLDIELAKKLRPPGPTSARRVVAVKGYQGLYGRALDALRAIEMCADVLQDFTVVIYFPNPDVTVAAELMSQRTGIKVEIFPHSTYEDSLRLHGRARVSVTVNISDGLPLSTIEAALMGSFPVQTDTSCIGERLRDGVGTLLVPSDDTRRIAAAVRHALTDDELVDRAADINFQYIATTMSREAVTPRVVDMYEKISGAKRAHTGGGALRPS